MTPEHASGTANATTRRAGAVTTAAQATRVAPLALRRYSICERQEARVTLNELRLTAEAAPLLAVGCGSSVHVLGFERFGAVLEPRRLLELRLPPGSPAEAPHAIEAIAADVDGDGRPDLVTAALLVDAAGSPRGGGVFVAAQRAEGGFERARRLLELAPVDIAAAALDTAPGQDLLLLNGADARLARPSALWLVTAGPAPVRAAIREASVDSRAVAACDLDGDGLDELIEGGGQDGLVRVWPSGAAAGAQVRTVASKNVRELLCFGGPGPERAVAVAAEQLSLLRAPPGADPELLPVTDGLLRNLHTLDVEGDGTPELIGYAHPEILAFARGAHGLERRLVATLAGQTAVLEARLVQLGGEPTPELIVLSVAGDVIAISALADVVLGSTVELPLSLAPAPTGQLMQHITLR
jgi:hypothetical protein